MKLSDFVDINPRTSLPKGTVAEFVPMEALNPQRRYVRTYPKKAYSGGTKFVSGDTLFARITPCLENGKISQFISDSAEPAFGSTEYWILRAKDGVSDAAFVYYLAKSDILRKPAEKSMVGASGRQRAQIEAVQDLDIGDMSLGDQQKIAGILGAYDDLIENNSKRIEKLETMARLLYQNNVKDGAIETELSEATDLITRGISPKYDESGTSIAINQRCIRDQKIDLTVARRQSKKIPTSKLVRDGDVLINSTGVGTLGRVAQVFGDLSETTVDSHVSIVRPNDDVNQYFFGAALMSQQEEFERLGIGATGQTELGRDAIGRVTILLPSRDVQEEVGNKIQAIRGLIYNLQRRTLKLSQARDLLLPRLIFGDIEV